MTEEAVSYIPRVDSECPFCSSALHARKVGELGTVYAIYDMLPVTDGHVLVIPYRHTGDYFSMTTTEQDDARDLLRVMKDYLLSKDSSIEGFNVGMNCGQVAGQTVKHAHIHLIPRRKGDVDDPHGGVRGVFPDKQKY